MHFCLSKTWAQKVVRWATLGYFVIRPKKEKEKEKEKENPNPLNCTFPCSMFFHGFEIQLEPYSWTRLIGNRWTL